jgi:hypothetical protein
MSDNKESSLIEVCLRGFVSVVWLVIAFVWMLTLPIAVLLTLITYPLIKRQLLHRWARCGNWFCARGIEVIEGYVK